MAKNTMNEIYVINLSSNDAVCGVKINEMLVMKNNKAAEGHYSAGQNISNILTDGQNTLGLIMYNGSIIDGREKLTSDMWCEVELNKLSEKGNSTFVSGIKLTGNEERGNFVVSDKYKKNNNQIYFGGPNRESEFDVLKQKINLMCKGSQNGSGKKQRLLRNLIFLRFKRFI
ncbi:hypothetical protein AB6E88_21570 [Providencia hangzhouensis]